MSKFNGKIVLITGGASGIGRIMGELALKKGASALVIWDINQANIDATIGEMKVFGKVVGYRVDVSDYETVASSYAKVKEEVGDVDILINCAGIITSNKTFDLCSAEEMDRTIKVNTLAPMYVARQVLPDMIKRNSGHICNIASAGGMPAALGLTAYVRGVKLQLGEKLIHYRRFSRTRRTGHDENAVRLFNVHRDLLVDVFRKPHVLEVERRRRLVENTHYDRFAMSCRQARYTKVDRFTRYRKRDTTVLRDTALRNIEVRKNLDTRNDRWSHLNIGRFHLVKSAVDAVTDFEIVFKRLDMNIRRAVDYALIKNEIYKTNNRR